MKFLILLAVVCAASAFKQTINIGGQQVIGDNDGLGLSGPKLGGARGAGLAGSLGGAGLGGSGLGGAGSSFSSGRLSSQAGLGSGKGLAGSRGAIASPVIAFKAQAQRYAPAVAAPAIQLSPIQQQVEQVVESLPQQIYAPQQQVAAVAPGYGSGSLGSGSFGAGLGSGSLGAGLGSLSSLGQAYDVAQPGGIITAAVQRTYRIQYVDVPSTGGPSPVQQIVIPANAQPLEIAFQSQSSPISVKQVHIPGQAAAPQVSSHQEEPDLLKTEVIKPIIHEVIEAIQPIRKITQEIRPVLETVNQIISRGEQVQKVQSAIAAAPAAAQAAIGIAAPQVSSSFVGSVAVAKPKLALELKPIQISLPTPQLAISRPKSIALPQPQVVAPQPQISFKPQLAAVASAQQSSQDVQQISQDLIDKKAAK